MDKKAMKSLKWTMILASAGYIILAILLFAMPVTIQSSINVLLAILALVLGVFRVVAFFMDKSANRYLTTDLASGILLIVLGIFLFSNPDYLWTILPIVIGFIILFDSVLKIQNALSIQQMHYSYWWLFAVLSVVTAVLGVLLIFGTLNGTSLIYFLAAVLLADGIVNIIVAISLSVLTNKFSKAVRNAAKASEPIEAEIIGKNPSAQV